MALSAPHIPCDCSLQEDRNLSSQPGSDGYIDLCKCDWCERQLQLSSLARQFHLRLRLLPSFNAATTPRISFLNDCDGPGVHQLMKQIGTRGERRDVGVSGVKEGGGVQYRTAPLVVHIIRRSMLTLS
jgi:hypothetical protein